MARVFDSIEQGLSRMRADIITGMPETKMALALQIAQDVKNNEFVPNGINSVAQGLWPRPRNYIGGQLGNSALRTPQDKLRDGYIIWSTPYARRRYFENFVNPDKTKWDIRAWQANHTSYTKQFKDGLKTVIWR